MIFQTNLPQLTNPESLTTGLAIFILGFNIILLYGSIKVRSIIGMFLWAISMFALIISFTFNLSLIWFWASILLGSIGLTIGMIIREVF